MIYGGFRIHMKAPIPVLLAGLCVLTSAGAAPLFHEPFAYPAASPLTGLTGGTGWPGAWLTDGGSVSVTSAGLQYSDTADNVLTVSGLAANTAGTATTRSLRDFGSPDLNNVWISFLYQLPASNGKFEGVSFYRATQQVFTVSNPSTTATPAIYLTNNLVGGTGVNTGLGVFGQTHLVVLKLTKSGGTGGADRVQAFIDPGLASTPSSPNATMDGTNFDFNRVRIAGQDGSALLVDELRIGASFADVTPHIFSGDPDVDGDGLTNSQEALLGLDPDKSDAALLAGIRAHPDWFGLYTASGILDLANGGVILRRDAADPVSLIFEVQQSENLAAWTVFETITRQIELPAGKNFLRIRIETP